MILCDMHTHTSFSDGKNTAEEMIQHAIKTGMKTIGISEHCYTNTNAIFGMSKENANNYMAEMSRLKSLYGDKIRILCGIEQDSFAGKPVLNYDYVIGSVHYVLKNGEYLPVDHSEKLFVDAVNKHYNGDFYAFAEDYYKNVATVLQDTGADIIGHFDLVTKFNEGYKLFDETNPRYIHAYQYAVDALIPYNKPFEINTGAISRGYRTEPYPSVPILNYIFQKGGSVMLSSDSHCCDSLCFAFEKYETLAQEIGFNITYL